MKEIVYIGNKNNKSFHSPDCMYAPKKLDKRVVFYSRLEAFNTDYQPCSNCLELEEGEVVGNYKTEKYHKPDCRFAPKSPKKRKVFNSKEEAESNGYKACRCLKPRKK